MPFKAKVTIEGKEHEVEIAGAFSEEQVRDLYMPKAAFEGELKRRADSITAGMFKLDDVATNPELKAKVLEKAGVKPGQAGDGKSGLDDAQVAELIGKAKQGWVTEFTEQQIKPRETKLTKATERITVLTRQALRNEILTGAAGAGVKKALLTGSNGMVPPIVAMLEPSFGYDETTERWYARDNDGFRMAPNPTKDRLHMTVDEMVKAWAGDKSNGEFVDSTAQGGPGVGQAGTSGGKKDVILTPEQAEDHAQYSKALDQAVKQGGHVRVVAPQQ